MLPLQEIGGPADQDPKVEVIAKGPTTGTSSAPIGKIKIKRKRPTPKEGSTSKYKPEINVQKEEEKRKPEINVQKEEEKRVGGDKDEGENVTDQPPPGPTSTVDEGVQGPSPGGKEPSPTRTADDAGNEPSPAKTTGIDGGAKEPSPDKTTSAAVDGVEEPAPEKTTSTEQAFPEKTTSTVGDEGE